MQPLSLTRFTKKKLWHKLVLRGTLTMLETECPRKGTPTPRTLKKLRERKHPNRCGGIPPGPKSSQQRTRHSLKPGKLSRPKNVQDRKSLRPHTRKPANLLSSRLAHIGCASTNGKENKMAEEEYAQDHQDLMERRRRDKSRLEALAITEPEFENMRC